MRLVTIATDSYVKLFDAYVACVKQLDAEFRHYFAEDMPYNELLALKYQTIADALRYADCVTYCDVDTRVYGPPTVDANVFASVDIIGQATPNMEVPNLGVCTIRSSDRTVAFFNRLSVYAEKNKQFTEKRFLLGRLQHSDLVAGFFPSGLVGPEGEMIRHASHIRGVEEKFRYLWES
jgi:hypothetical protein